MSIMVDGIGLPRNGCIGCYFRTAKYCGLKESNDYVWNYAEKGTRPDNCPITEVIRCKDCKYFSTDFNGNNRCDLYMDAYSPWAESQYSPSESDFCSKAERKEE